MSVPPELSDFSISIEDRSPSAKAVPVAVLRIASAKVNVIFALASLNVPLFAGLKSGDGAVVSTVNVALAAVPALAAAS